MGATGGQSAVTETLVIDRSFEIKTADPQRAFEPTAQIVDRGIYDTFFTYNGGDLAHPRPLLVQSWTVSRMPRRSSSTCADVRFADGTPLTAADAVFSFRRLINLKGNPSFLLDGVTVSSRGRYTVVLRSKTPNLALPSILTNTSLGIVNSKLVRAHGGTAAPGADKNDKAEQWLNSSASRGAGSGPYLLDRYSTTSQITLVPNTRYWGPYKPNFKTVVVRNMIAPTQLINIQRGKHEVAIDLSSDQAQGIKATRPERADRTSTWVFFLLMNNDSSVSSITSNKQFQTAVRYALDYRSVVSVAGPGRSRRRDHPVDVPRFAAAPGGDSAEPDESEGGAGRPAPRTRPSRSSSRATSRSTACRSRRWRSGSRRTCRRPVSRSSLPVRPSAPGCRSTATARWPSACRSGAGLSGSGRLPRLHAGRARRDAGGWPAGSDATIERLAATARMTTAEKPRETIYRQIQRRLNAVGPFIPLLQPVQVFVSTRDLRGAPVPDRRHAGGAEVGQLFATRAAG